MRHQSSPNGFFMEYQLHRCNKTNMVGRNYQKLVRVANKIRASGEYEPRVMILDDVHLSNTYMAIKFETTGGVMIRNVQRNKGDLITSIYFALSHCSLLTGICVWLLPSTQTIDAGGATILTIDELLHSNIFPSCDAHITFVMKQSTTDVPLFESLLPLYLKDWCCQARVAVV